MPNTLSHDFGIYSTLDYDREKIGLNTGVRLDYKKIHCSEKNYHESFSSINSSLGIFFKHKNHLLRLTYSGSFRAPHVSELFSNGVHHGTNRYEIGKVDLDIEKSHQFDIKYQWSSEHLGFVLDPFAQYIHNFIAINPSDSLYKNIYRIYNYNQFNRVNMLGFELSAHYHPHFLHNLHFEQSYTFLNTTNYDTQNVLALTPANKIKTRINLDLNTWNLKLLSLMKTHIFLI